MLQIQDIMCTLEKRQKELERVICNGKKVEKELPQGRLRINHNRGVVEYYRITEKNDTCGKYLRKSDKELIRNLAQREYIDTDISLQVLERGYKVSTIDIKIKHYSQGVPPKQFEDLRKVFFAKWDKKVNGQWPISRLSKFNNE